jgi:hypothetical protein
MTHRNLDPGPMAAAVEVALSAAAIRNEDGAAAELARHYAALIDNATPASKYRAPLRDLRRGLDMMVGLGEPLAAAQAGEALEKVTDALAAHSVASDIGPKLLAALVALGLTPAAARGVTINGSATAGPRVESEFERLRRERDERTRQHGT